MPRGLLVELKGIQVIFAVPVPDCTMKTCKEVLTKHICPGTRVITDCWKGYLFMDMDDSELQHEQVNHEKGFKAPHTDVHTNSIEGWWGHLKRWDGPQTRRNANLDMTILVGVWRKQNEKDLWGGLMKAV